MEFWRNRWYNTGTEFAEGVAGPVNYFLPYDKLEEATLIMRGIMDKHGIKNYAQQMFIGPSCSEHVSLMFHYPNDREEYAKIQKACDEMMKKSLELGAAPIPRDVCGARTSRKTWGNRLLKLAQQIKKWLDPNNIMNPGVVGLNAK